MFQFQTGEPPDRPADQSCCPWSPVVSLAGYEDRCEVSGLMQRCRGQVPLPSLALQPFPSGQMAKYSGFAMLFLCRLLVQSACNPNNFLMSLARMPPSPLNPLIALTFR